MQGDHIVELLFTGIGTGLVGAGIAAKIVWGWFTRRLESKDAEIARLNEARLQDERERGDRGERNTERVIALAKEQKSAMQTVLGGRRP